jgi:SpoIIAA-like
MIRVIENMPVGTIGLEAVGKVTEDDYRDVLVPAVSAALERGVVRLLYVLGKEFDSYSAGALWADTKLLAGNRKAWKKVAIVSDADWLENSVKAFGWLMPGEVKVFETDEVHDAKEWLVGLDDDDDDDD